VSSASLAAVLAEKAKLAGKADLEKTRSLTLFFRKAAVGEYSSGGLPEAVAILLQFFANSKPGWRHFEK